MDIGIKKHAKNTNSLMKTIIYFLTMKGVNTMETNEIMNNEEVIEATAENIVERSSNDDLKKVAGIGIAIVAGVLAYRHIAKPIAAKLKDYYQNKKATEEEKPEEVIVGDAVEVDAE